ncbi:hypothetical protein Y032_0060g3095 [Ancylostoma ceylanicum]|uniref:Uncharacterized protein n=1 Tax=Ancylostoma ceylanicum TaxID=53326 RepID=A0A016U262_9BILA|nr:hypothetical protein Y032_0060g3095 [Ancylostoma ceylanicum]
MCGHHSCVVIYQLLGKTTEDVERKIMNLPTMEKDLTYNETCEMFLDNYTYIPIEYMRKGYKARENFRITTFSLISCCKEKLQTLSAEDYRSSFLNYPKCCGMKARPYNHIYRPFSLRIFKRNILKHILEDGNCRTSLDNVLEYVTLFLKAYKGM